VDNLLGFLQIGAVGAAGSIAESSFLDGIAQGDAEAIREAYRAHHVAVRAFAGRFLGDTAAAEDLVHDVFVALPRAIRRFRGDSSFEGFLIGMAVNLARRHLRSSKRRRGALAKLSVEPPSTPELPDQAASDRELSLRLMHALDGLPDKLRIAFVLVQIEERDASEVSALLRVPASTVRARVRAARTRLQSFEHLGPRKELA
jgi:RNA polymerase sigma-70 factor (ECF subfamily)